MSASDDLKWLLKIVSCYRKQHRLKLGRLVRLRLGGNAPGNGSRRPWGAEGPDAFHRFDMSICLVHDVALSGGGRWEAFDKSDWERRTISKRERVQGCEIVLNRAAESARLGQLIGVQKGAPAV